jgi:hypothetical protein
MRMCVFCFVSLVLLLGGCTAAKPIITPQEYQGTCRSTPLGADRACVDRVCDSYQETVTDYHDNKEACILACRAKAESLSSGLSGACLAKVADARSTCEEYCFRKFYRCNCDKIYVPGNVTN